MKLHRRKNQLLIVFLAAGFLVGIIYENVMLPKFGVTVTVFEKYFLEQYRQMEVVTEEYLWYVTQARMIPFIGICVLGCLRWKKIVSVLWVVWTGFLSGIMTVSAIMQLGMKGILLCVAMLIPHMVCYGFAYVMLLLYLFRYPEKQWNMQKTMFVVFMMFLGIILESYVNPILVKLIAGIL